MKTHVVKTTPDDTLGGALDLMDLYQVDSLPIVDEAGRLIGQLTEGAIADVVLRGIDLAADDAVLMSDLRHRCDLSALRVADIMTVTTHSISATEDAHSAALALLRSGQNRLPVVDSHGSVIGTFNRVDVLQAVFERLL